MSGAGAKVLLGLSGGVDSSVAALLLRERGYEVIAAAMTIGLATDAQTLAAARAAAAQLGIPFLPIDLAADYRREVLEDFRACWLFGLTPNPCVRCNERVKFGLFPAAARAAGADFSFLATGHYARTTPDGRLFAARDAMKDQSYFLYRVPRETLAHTLLPLGEMTKDEVRAAALAHGLAAAERADSQDFCAGAARDVVGAADRPGAIVDERGRALGEHLGHWRYTVGQRRGLGVGGGTPLYVVRIDAARNEVVVGPRTAAAKRAFPFRDRVGDFEGTCRIKVRSTARPVPGRVEGDHCALDEDVVGVAPGQSAVWYAANGEVLGGGIIG